MSKLNISKDILKGLEEWAGQEARSSWFLTFYRKLLDIQAEVEEQLEPPEPGLDAKEMDKRLWQGKPLLRFEELELDWDKVNAIFRHIATALAEHPHILGQVPPLFTHLDFKLPKEWVRAWLEGGELPAEIEGQKIDQLMLSTLIQQTLRPFLVGYAQAFKGSFDQDRWRRIYCPICGSKPEFAYLEKEVGARWLVCSTCGNEWLFKRTECPYCGNSDHRTLSFLTGNDSPYRLYLCQKCHSYLKAIDLRKTDKQHLMPLEALTTLALDRQAQEMGYHRGV